VGVIIEVVSMMKLIAPGSNEWFAFGLLGWLIMLPICSILRVCIRAFWSMIWWPAADRVLAAFSLSLVLSRAIFWLIFVLFLAPVVLAFLFSFFVPREAVGFSAAYTHKLVVIAEVVMSAVSLAFCIAVVMVLLEA